MRRATGQLQFGSGVNLTTGLPRLSWSRRHPCDDVDKPKLRAAVQPRQLLEVEYPLDVVQVAAVDGIAGLAGCPHHLDHLRVGCILLDADNPRAGGHHLVDGVVVEVPNPFQVAELVLLDVVGVVALLNQDLDFLL